MQRFAPDFPSQLVGFTFETLERDPQSIFALSADLALTYFNPGWLAFARDNDGEPAISTAFGLGTPIARALVGDARDFYLQAFACVLREGEAWHHDYECSSPATFRLFHQSVYPLRHRQGLIVVNSLVREEPMAATGRTAHEPLTELYLQATGLIVQCSNCRRVRRRREQDAWDWVPAWVRTVPPNTSHTFCQLCFEYYHGD